MCTCFMHLYRGQIIYKRYFTIKVGYTLLLYDIIVRKCAVNNIFENIHLYKYISILSSTKNLNICTEY